MIRKMAIAKCLLAFGIFAACNSDKKADTPVVQPTPTPTSTPTNGPTLKEAAPAQGFLLEDLVTKYCTVTLVDSEQELVLSHVSSLAVSGSDDVLFSYYLKKSDGTIGEKSGTQTAQVKSSTCDLQLLKTGNSVNLLLAPISVYADSSLSGGPTCVLPAGLTTVSPDSYLPASYGVLPFNVPDSFDCNGLKRGVLNEWPLIVQVYLKP